MDSTKPLQRVWYCMIPTPLQKRVSDTVGYKYRYKVSALYDTGKNKELD